MYKYKEPFEYANQHYDRLAALELQQDWDQREMDAYFDEAVEKLTKGIPSHISDILTVLAFGYENDCREAIKIADDLRLDEVHFIAIANNLPKFIKWRESNSYDF